MNNLSLEQQFEITAFNQKIDELNLEQLKDLIKYIYEKHIVIEQQYKDYIGTLMGFK